MDIRRDHPDLHALCPPRAAAPYLVLQKIRASLGALLGENGSVNATTHPRGLDDTALHCSLSLSLGSTESRQVADLHLSLFEQKQNQERWPTNNKR